MTQKKHFLKIALTIVFITMLLVASIFVLSACSGNDESDRINIRYSVQEGAVIVSNSTSGHSSSGFYGDDIRLPLAHFSGHDFEGWVDSNGNRVQAELSSNTANTLNTTLSTENLPMLASLEEGETLYLQAKFVSRQIQVIIETCSDSEFVGEIPYFESIIYGNELPVFSVIAKRAGFVYSGLYEYEGNGARLIDSEGAWNRVRSKVLQGSSFSTIASARPISTREENTLRLYTRFSLNFLLPQGMNATFGDELNSLNLPLGWEWLEPNRKVGFVGEQMHLVHNGGNSYYLFIHVERATPVYELPTPQAVFGQTLSQVSLPDGWSWVFAGTTSVGNAGERLHQAMFTPNDQHNFYSIERNIILTVNRANPAPPPFYDAVFGQTLSNVNLPLGWSWTEPTTTLVGNAGIRTHYARFLQTSNFNGVDSQRVTINVARADPIVSTPITRFATYGQILSQVSLPTATNGTWSWVATGTTRVGNVGTRNFYARFTPNDTANFNTIEQQAVGVFVSRATPTGYTVPTIANQTFSQGRLLSAINLPENWRWESPNLEVGNATVHLTPNTRSFYVVYSRGSNFLDRRYSVSIRVNRANPIVTTPASLIGGQYFSLSLIELPARWSWDEPNTALNTVGNQTFWATYTPANATNFNTVRRLITVQVQRVTEWTFNSFYAFLNSGALVHTVDTIRINFTTTELSSGINNTLTVPTGITTLKLFGDGRTATNLDINFQSPSSNVTLELNRININAGNRNQPAVRMDGSRQLEIVNQGWGTNTLTGSSGRQGIAVQSGDVHISGAGTLNINGGHGADGVSTTAGGIGIVANSITITGSLNITIRGGNGGTASRPATASTAGGPSGGNGGIGISATTLTVNLEGSRLEVRGGNGGNGAQARWSGSGAGRRRGGHGGNGATAINTTNISISTGWGTRIYGGNGGRGYAGGDTSAFLSTAGNGGNGGVAGHGIIATGTVAISSSITVTGGNGGAAGNGGAGTGGDTAGGVGGSGGTGGDALRLRPNITVPSQATLIAGTGGARGNGGRGSWRTANNGSTGVAGLRYRRI